MSMKWVGSLYMSYLGIVLEMNITFEDKLCGDLWHYNFIKLSKLFTINEFDFTQNIEFKNILSFLVCGHKKYNMNHHGNLHPLMYINM